MLAFESNRNGHWDIYVVRSDGSAMRRVTSGAGDERYPSWSPDGASIVYAGTVGDVTDLFAINIDTGSVRQLTKTAAAESFPAWSPDGQWIAYTSSAAGQPMNLFRIRSDGSEVVQLTNDHTRSLYPRWSPDGRQLAFFSRRDTSGTDDEVYVLDLVTQQTSRWTSRPGHDFSPAWMADGRAIAMISLDANGDRALRVVNVDGSTRCRVLGVARVSDPAPGPDGRRIAYAAAAGQYLGIVVHTLDAAPADCR